MNLVVNGYLMRRENSEREKKWEGKKEERREAGERERKKRENDFLMRKEREV